MVIGASGWTWVIAAAMCLLLAVWLARVGRDRRAVRHLIVFLVTLALFDLANGFALSGSDLGVPWYLLPFATIMLPAAALSFYAAYQESGRKHPWTIGLWSGAALLFVLTLLFPELWVSRGVLGPVFILYGLNYLLFAALAFELTREAVRNPDDADKRRSMLWLALGFSFIPAYVATSEFFFIDVLRRIPYGTLFFNIAHFVSLMAGAILAAMFFLLARAALRTQADEQKVDVAWFMLAVIAPAATVFFQMLFMAFNAYDAVMAVAMEGVWAMLFPMFVAFSVARYQPFGLVQDSRPGLRRILFALIWPMAGGLGYMAWQNSFPDANMWFVIAAFTLLPLPAVKVLWQQSNVWAGKVLGCEPESDNADASSEVSHA